MQPGTKQDFQYELLYKANKIQTTSSPDIQNSHDHEERQDIYNGEISVIKAFLCFFFICVLCAQALLASK